MKKVNEFKLDYEIYNALEYAWKKLEKHPELESDELNEQVLIKKYREQQAKMESKGNTYCFLYRMYETSAKKGNEEIDIYDNIMNIEISELISTLKENGIEKFTFSSTWSSSIKDAYEFVENSCVLVGMTEINDGEDIWSKKQMKKPAFVFEIK